METLTIELSPKAYHSLQERARRTGKPLQAISQEILEQALREEEQVPKTARDILEASGRLRPLGPVL